MISDSELSVEALQSLATNAFKAFCADFSIMFGNLQFVSAETGTGKLSDLKKDFNTLAYVNQIWAQGDLNGKFPIIVDKAGVFILGGTLVMLPKSRILEIIRSGTIEEAVRINDATREVGNLLTGSWDRISRKQLQRQHLKQSSTFVGALWDNPSESIGLSSDENCRYVISKMKLNDFPEFKCASVFSDRLFEAKCVTQ